MINNDTLWKTCRVLANKTRLNILRDLMCGAELCVLDIARVENLTEVVASQHLRLLHEHGFLQLKRKSKWVFYRSEEPMEGSYAEHFFKPLRTRLLFGSNQTKDLIRLFTAFTHPRRIGITKALLQRDRTFDELIGSCDISGQALYRHLDKLTAREFVIQKNNICQIIRYGSGLRKALLEACEAT
jgi:DNA-binding transcriptional ArsR family regulator